MSFVTSHRSQTISSSITLKLIPVITQWKWIKIPIVGIGDDDIRGASNKGENFIENGARVLNDEVPFVGEVGDMVDEKGPPLLVVNLFFKRYNSRS